MPQAQQYLSEKELAALGLASCGRHVFISRHAMLTRPERVHIGSRVRIDHYAIIDSTSTINIGDNVHIGSHVGISAVAPVFIGNYSGISGGTKLFTTDDDYSGAFLTGPTVPADFTNITTAEVRLEEHCIVGANSVILPGAVLEQGVAVGAMSLVKGTLAAWGVYGGVPARLIKPRSKDLLIKAEEAYPSS